MVLKTMNRLGCCLMTATLFFACSNPVATLTISTQPFNDETEQVNFSMDSDKYIHIFDGTSYNGWRGYGMNEVPQRWTIEDDCMHLLSEHTEEGSKLSGGDLIFAHKVENFELQMEWKLTKGGNSGIMYMVVETKTTDENGQEHIQPSWFSSPEYQLYDSEKAQYEQRNGTAALYDILPARPSNPVTYTDWNQSRIRVENGHVTHSLNGEDLVEYDLWTPEWTEMLRNSKFGPDVRPLAFQLQSTRHKGYICFQDYGDELWFRNIRIKLLD